MSSVRLVWYPVLMFTLVACDRVASGTVTQPDVTADFLNGPDDLPNVVRIDGQVGFAIRDPDAQLVVLAGWPANPADLTLCGGTVPFQGVSIQTSGELEGVLHDLRIGTDLGILVFDLSTFRGPCRSTPFASGEGRAMRNDNDLNVSLTRGNSFGMRIIGDVTGAAGERYHVNAESRMVMLPDGTFKAVVQSVHLVPVGGP